MSSKTENGCKSIPEFGIGGDVCGIDNFLNTGWGNYYPQIFTSKPSPFSRCIVLKEILNFSNAFPSSAKWGYNNICSRIVIQIK